jgi:predicted RNase H-like HicB family nuclease
MVIYWSEVDAAFIVEVPELPGCMADGLSYQEAVANAERIIEE